MARLTTPEQQLAACRAALTEIGRNPRAAHIASDGVVAIDIRSGDSGAVLNHPTEAEVWMTLYVVGGPEGMACWPCWSIGEGEDCTHDPAAEPKPNLRRV